MTEQLLRLDEAARRLGLSTRTLRRHLASGALRGRKATANGVPVAPGAIGRHEWRIPESALNEFSNRAFAPTQPTEGAN